MLESLVTDCRAALREDRAERAVREAVARAVSDVPALLRELGEPARAGIQRLHVASDLTILNVVWGPKMTLMPHDHRMWAVIGVYGGREDNIYWRRIEGDPEGRIEAAGARALGSQDVLGLGPDIVHSVTNPIPRLTGALHVYGGDFFETRRSEWDPETLAERPFSVENALRAFEESNANAMGSRTA